MSINYTPAPHRVDIPVTDLDDDTDDDILFHQQHEMGPLASSSEDNIEDLDFEAHKDKPFIDRVKRFFDRDQYSQVESYELRDTNYMNQFEISEDEDQFRDRYVPDTWKNTVTNKYTKGVFGVLVVIAVLLAFNAMKLWGAVETSGSLGAKTILTNSTHEFHPTTIVVSLDGFHPHYISAKLTPALHDMMLNEFGAPYMTPSFPSSTFPNHWTLVTGLYPSEHGVVGNTFYDPKMKKQFVNTNPKLGGLDPDFWKGGEPVWETAFKQGVNSAVHMWPGSEVPGVGIDNGPLEVDRYNGSELLSSKVDKVFNWIDRKDINQRPELILTYVPTIDSYGHKYGISGGNLTHALSYVDDFVDLMREQITARNLTDIVNLVILSDHGMAPTSNDRLLYLDDLIDLKKVEHIDGWPLFGLRPYKDHSVDDIFKELVEKFDASSDEIKKNFQIYRVDAIPKEWEFGGALEDHKFNYRLAPIWIVPKVGYSITTHQQMEEKNGDYTPKGVHGYNNTELLMRATFLATGPYFRSLLTDSNKRVKPFKNTEVYNLICHSLNLTPAANNGTMKDGYIVPVISQKNHLPKHWTDSLVYPGLDYEVSHIVEDATYDLLWKPKDKDSGMKTVYMSSNHNPAGSLSSEESTLNVNPAVSLPKPSDFSTSIDDARPTKISKPSESDSDSDSDSDEENDESKHHDDLKHHQDESKGHEDELKDHDDSEGDDSKDKGIMHGIWNKIGHFEDNLEDAFKDIGEGIEDTTESVGDSVKSGWKGLSSFLHGGKNNH